MSNNADGIRSPRLPTVGGMKNSGIIAFWCQRKFDFGIVEFCCNPCCAKWGGRLLPPILKVPRPATGDTPGYV